MAREYSTNMGKLKQKLVKSLIYEQKSKIVVIEEVEQECEEQKGDLIQRVLGLLSSCPDSQFKAKDGSTNNFR